MTLDLSNPDRLPFRDLPDEVAAGMVIAARNGGVAEYFSRPDGDWHAPSEVSWFLNTIYRIRPAPVTADVIPWAALQPQWRWAARDASGSVWVYTERPTCEIQTWCSEGDMNCLGDLLLAGVIPGTCDWRDSLQQRPGGV